MAAELYLASASPRRRELLTQIGVAFATVSVDIDEKPNEGELPDHYVARLAKDKAQAGWLKSKNLEGLPVLGADTTVVSDGQMMGKPLDRKDALAMLAQLSGKTHQVLTGIALIKGARTETRVVSTEVQFRELSLGEIERYWETSEPKDKAGAYGIQGLASVFVSRIDGSYSNVVGLPLLETAELLVNFGVSIWHGGKL